MTANVPVEGILAMLTAPFKACLIAAGIVPLSLGAAPATSDVTLVALLVVGDFESFGAFPSILPITTTCLLL